MRLLLLLQRSLMKKENEYELLPPNTNTMPLQRLSRISHMRRKTLFLACISVPLLLFGLYYHYHEHVEAVVQTVKEMVTDKLPPNYERFYDMERKYPQHDITLPYPEGQYGRYLWVSNQHWGKHAFSLYRRLV